MVGHLPRQGSVELEDRDGIVPVHLLESLVVPKRNLVHIDFNALVLLDKPEDILDDVEFIDAENIKLDEAHHSQFAGGDSLLPGGDHLAILA